MKYLVFLLISLSVEVYADNKKYLNEFDNYLSYVNELQNSNDVVMVDPELISNKYIYRLELKAKLMKKTIKVINKKQDSLLAKK
mgnify:CR=1 FL=1